MARLASKAPTERDAADGDVCRSIVDRLADGDGGYSDRTVGTTEILPDLGDDESCRSSVGAAALD